MMCQFLWDGQMSYISITLDK